MKTAILNLLALALLTPFLKAESLPEEALSSHQKAAEELLLTTNAQETSKQMANLVFNSFFNSLPDKENTVMRDELKTACHTWADKVLNWQEIRMDFINLYTKAFTEKELKELSTFYKSGAGQKSIELMGGLMQQGAAIGEARAQLYQDESNESVSAIIKKHTAAKQE